MYNNAQLLIFLEITVVANIYFAGSSINLRGLYHITAIRFQ